MQEKEVLEQDETKKEESVVLQMSDKEAIEQYFNDDSVKEKLDLHAIHFNEVAHGNWVTVERLVKKSQIKKPLEVKMILDILVMSKRAFAKKEGDVIKYKITLGKESRKRVLENQIKNLEDALISLKAEYTELSK